MSFWCEQSGRSLSLTNPAHIQDIMTETFMRKAAITFLAFVVIILTFSFQYHIAAAEVSRELIVGTWKLNGETFSETYTFKSNGGYEYEMFGDFASDSESGTWKLNKDEITVLAKGPIHKSNTRRIKVVKVTSASLSVRINDGPVRVLTK